MSRLYDSNCSPHRINRLTWYKLRISPSSGRTGRALALDLLRKGSMHWFGRLGHPARDWTAVRRLEQLRLLERMAARKEQH